MNLFLWTFFGFFGVIFGIIALGWILPRLLQDESTRLLDDFMTRAYKRGLTPQQAFAEMDLRTALAKARRLATEDVLRNPHDLDAWRRRLAEAAEEVTRRNPAEGVRFVQWTSQLGFSDVLYPEAARLYWKALRAEPVKSRGLDRDQVAALRVR